MQIPLQRFRVGTLARACCLAFGVSLTVTAQAQEFAIDTGFEMRSSVNSNFLFQPGVDQNVLVLALTPYLSVLQSSESSTLRLDASTTSFWVPDQHDDDHTNLNLAISYAITEEKDRYGLALSLVRNLTIDTELASTGVLLQPLRRVDLTATPSWTHSFTERLQGSIQLMADATTYTGPDAAAGVENYHYYAGVFSTSYLADEFDTLTLTLTPSIYQPDHVDEHIDSSQLQIGWQGSISEELKLSLSAGEFEEHARQNVSFLACPYPVVLCELGFAPFEVVKERLYGKNYGHLLDASLNYQFEEATLFTIHESRSLSPSGLGTMLLVQSLDTSVKHNFAENIVGSLTYSRAHGDYLQSEISAFSLFQSLQLDVAKKLDAQSKVDLGIRRQNAVSAGTSLHAESNEVFASYQYLWPHSSTGQSSANQVSP